MKRFGHLRVFTGNGYGRFNPLSNQGDPVVTPIDAVTLATDKTISSGYPAYEDVTGLTCSFTTVTANQSVNIYVEASALSAGANATAFMAYNLNGGADVVVPDVFSFTAGGYGNLSTIIRIKPSTPATYNFQLRAAKGTTNFTFGSTGGSAEMPATIFGEVLA